MATFVADKYDWKNDPDLPKAGSIINDGKWEVVKAEAVTVEKLMAWAEDSGGREPDLVEGSGAVTIMDHSSRPFLKYIVWYKNVT